MTIALIAALASALVASVFALRREVRLRKAVEKLLQTILSKWRAHGSKSNDSDVDRISQSDQWL